MTSAPATPDDAPKFRYSGALAQEIELRWQDRWDARRHLRDPEPGRPAGGPGQDRRPAEEAVRARHVPVPIRNRPARRPSARVHRHRHLHPVQAHDRLQRHVHHGLRCLWPTRRAVRRADRAASGGHHQRQRRQLSPPASPAGAQPRPTAQRQHHRSRLLPLDAVDLPADLQLVVRHRSRQGPTHRRAGRTACVRPPGHPRRKIMGRPLARRAQRRRRRSSPRLRQRRSGQLVPGSRHRGRQRRGHRRRP